MNRIYLLFALAMACLGPVLAQVAPPAWGFAPPLNVSTSGNYITYSPTNYLTQDPATTTIYFSGNHQEAEGVGTYVDFSGNCYAMIYDPAFSPSGAFRSTVIGSSSLSMNLGAASGIVYYSTAFDCNAATYDPFRQQWMQLGNTGLAIERVEEGVVLYRNSSNELEAAIYDPELGYWVSEFLTESINVSCQIETNLVRTNISENFKAFMYDFGDHSWHSNDVSYDLPVGGGGVICGRIGNNRVGGMTYDFDLHDWVEFEHSFPGGGDISIECVEGTVTGLASGTFYTFGYNPTSHQWVMGLDTRAKCFLYEYHPTPNPFSLVYATTYAIGAPVPTISCTDGYNLARTRGYKPFLTPGYFALYSTVNNFISQSECRQDVYFGQTLATEDAALGRLDISPNPVTSGAGIDIVSTKNMAALRLTNLLGVVVAESFPKSTESHLDLPSGLAAGTYILEATLPKGQPIRRKIVVQ